MASSTSPDSSTTAAPSPSEGPVLSVLTKRLRALKKKLNRIHQMEQTLALGKPLNSEQQEVLRSKPALLVQIEELEKLRQPLAQALQQELQQHQQQLSPTNCYSENKNNYSSVEDFVKLVYFGSLFDVKSQGEFNAMMLTRTHERGCCLTYDYVNDETTELLGEKDLDLISELGKMVTTRVSTVSHQSAVRECVEHAKLWLEGSEKPISPDSAITYAGLREKLRKIMASDFFTTTPEMRAPDDVAAAVEKYGAVSQVQISDGSEVALQEDETEEVAEYQQEEQEVREFMGTEHAPDDQSKPADEETKVEPDELDSFGEAASTEQEQQKHEAEFEEHDQRDFETKEHHYNSRGSYQNQRGGYRGGSRARRGYINGRGGRGGNRGGSGGYQNGRSQYNDSGYYPRTHFNSRGRGGRSGGSGTYYNQGGNYGSQAPATVELGTGA